MNSVPSIAVIIPAHNAAEFIAEAIKSALAQTRRPSEIIVTDDGSTDATARVAAGCDPMVRIVVNDRKLGIGAARNKAIRASSSDYIALLDADDLWRHDHLEQLAGALDRFPEAGVAFSRMQNFGSTTGLWPPESMFEVWDRPADHFIPLMRGQYYMPSATVYPRRLHEQIGWFDDTMPTGSEDTDFSCRIAARMKIIGCIEPTTLYRWHSNQVFKINWVPHVIKYFEYRDNLFDQLELEGLRLENLALAKERTAIQWEYYLDQAWRERRIDALRRMVSFGMRHSYLSASTRMYVFRSRLPSWLIYIRDRAIRCVLRRPEHFSLPET